MKTAIIYGTTYGTTHKVAKILSNGIKGESVRIPINKAKPACLQKYDFIIIGGSIHRGRIQSEIKQYTSRNLKTLLGKNLGLFILTNNDKDIEKYFRDSFTKGLVESARITGNFGNEIHPEKGNLITKKIMINEIENYLKTDEELPSLKFDKIQDFMNEINKLKIR